jgi:hypothetical protein
VELVDLKCSQCGAALPPQAESGVYRCTYCGHVYEAPPPAPAVAPEPRVIEIRIQGPGEAISHRRLVQARSGGGARSVGCIVPIVLAAAGFIAFESLRSTVKPQVVATAKGGKSDGLFSSSTSRMYWDSVGGSPVPVTIHGSAAAIGRVRVENDALNIVAVAPSSLKILWSVGNIGTYSQGYRATHFAAASDRVAISDYRSTIHIVELETGREVASTRLSDVVQRMCPTGPSTMWVGTVDKRSYSVDMKTGASKDAPANAACDDSTLSWAKQASSKSAGPKVAGFAAAHTLVDGDLGVAGGTKSPGTAIPMAVGFDPKSLAVRWQAVLPAGDLSDARARSNEHDALATGIYVTTYGMGHKNWHVVALEPRSGTRLWDTALPNIFAVDSISNVVAGGGWVYVTRTSSLAILNGSTGALVGAVGDETYEKTK